MGLKFGVGLFVLLVECVLVLLIKVMCLVVCRNGRVVCMVWVVLMLLF